MAKNINVAGMSIKQITSMTNEEISRLSGSSLATLTGRLVSAANKRLRRAKPTETGVWSPSVRHWAKQQGVNLEAGQKPQFTVKGPKGETPQQRVNRLRSVYSDIKGFLNAETSTQAGFKKYREKVVKMLGVNITKSRETENAFWDAYNRFMKDDHYAEIFKSKGSENEVLTWLREYAEKTGTYDTESLYNALNKELNREDIDNEEKFKTVDIKGISITPDELDIYNPSNI